VKAAVERGVAPAAVTDFTAVPGQGIQGKVEGHHILVGAFLFLKQQGVDLPFRESSPAVALAVIGIAIDLKPAGWMTVSDP